MEPPAAYEIVDLPAIEPVACPCGWARRAFAGADDFPATIHLTEITADARRHYHRQMIEVYTILEADPAAALELDGSTIPVRPGMSILIRPGTRHRAVGSMKVLIVASPKFDPADEWFD